MTDDQTKRDADWTARYLSDALPASRDFLAWDDPATDVVAEMREFVRWLSSDEYAEQQARIDAKRVRWMSDFYRRIYAEQAQQDPVRGLWQHAPQRGPRFVHQVLDEVPAWGPESLEERGRRMLQQFLDEHPSAR